MRTSCTCGDGGEPWKEGTEWEGLVVFMWRLYVYAHCEPVCWRFGTIREKAGKAG